MSRTFSKNRKELASVKLISAEEAYVLTKGGKRCLRKDVKFVGKITRGLDSMILNASSMNSKSHFVDDTSELPRATKEKIVDFFFNNKSADGRRRKVVYLIRGDKKKK